MLKLNEPLSDIFFSFPENEEIVVKSASEIFKQFTWDKLYITYLNRNFNVANNLLLLCLLNEV